MRINISAEDTFTFEFWEWLDEQGFMNWYDGINRHWLSAIWDEEFAWFMGDRPGGDSSKW